MKLAKKRDERLARLLAADALLPAGTSAPEGELVDTVLGRRYRHPALGDRPVVRLTPESLAPADDLEMEFLGFVPPTAPSPSVAIRRRRALGFPGWAMVNDRAHASFALEVVKELKKGARIAKSRPGAAKEIFDAIGVRLARSVPHFLPSYWEEVGRAFLALGNTMYAAQAFGKAREAERVHALAVDEGQRRQSFLDFALAGGLSIKSLSEYAAELAKGHSAATAFEHFRALSVSRTTGGMPPWSSMPDELRRLAKAAGLDADVEDTRLLEEILESPSMARAAGEVWKKYRKALLTLASESAKVRGILLNLTPEAARGEASLVVHWLDLLDSAGATQALVETDGTTPAEACPGGGAAAWLSRFVGLAQGGWRPAKLPKELFSLVTRMAPRLAKDGEPVNLAAGHGAWRHLSLDLCEHALSLGIPVADPDAERSNVNLNDWAAGQTEVGPLDPIHVARDARFSPLLDGALGSVMGKEPFETVSRGMAGLAEARRGWLLRLLGLLESTALPGFKDALKTLRTSASAQTFAETPEALQRLAAADPALALQRTLQIGLYDELSWPALENELEGVTDRLAVVTGSFPYLILAHGWKVTVIGPEGVVLTHDIVAPPRSHIEELRYAAGQIHVVYRDASYARVAYWSGSPTATSEGDYGNTRVRGYSWALPDGSVTEGERAYRPGDTKVNGDGELFCDGEHLWVVAFDGTEMRLRELAPVTGAKGRLSYPRFFEEFLGDGTGLCANECELMPLPAALRDSPLGSRGGLLGFRVKAKRGARQEEGWLHRTKTGIEAEGIDGRRFAGGLAGQVPWALLRFPADSVPRPISGGSRWGASPHSIWHPEGRFEGSTLTAGERETTFAKGTVLILPRPFWHFLSPRDESGSKALRGVSHETLVRLVEVARAEIVASTGSSRATASLTSTREAIASSLPEVTHEKLRLGVLGVVEMAAELTIARDALVSSRKAELSKAGSHPREELGDEAIGAAFAALGFAGGGRGGSASRQLREVAGFLLDPESGTRVALFNESEEPLSGERLLAASEIPWDTFVGRLAAIAFGAASMTMSAEHRETVLRMLLAFADTPFAGNAGTFRWVDLSFEGGKTPFRAGTWLGLVTKRGGSSYFLRRNRYQQDRATGLEWNPSGSFGLPDGVTVVAERRFDEIWETPERIRSFVERVRVNGPVPAGTDIFDALSSATGLTPTEAAVVWTGFQLGGGPSPQARERLGLKPKLLTAALESLKGLSRETHCGLLAAAMPDDPARLWEPLAPDGPVERLAASWRSLCGERIAPDEELSAALETALAPAIKPGAMLTAFLRPSGTTFLTRDAKVSFEIGNRGLELTFSDVQAFDLNAVRSLAGYVPYLFSYLPVGTPVRQGIPEVLELARERLGNPDLLLPGETLTFWSEADPKKARDTFFESLEGDRITLRRNGEVVEAKDGGFFLAAAPSSTYPQLVFAIRPSRLNDSPMPGSPVYLPYTAAVTTWNREPTLLGALSLLSEGGARMAERVATTPVPRGEYETNPLHATPHLVASLRETYSLSEDAAVLYLQTLALINPTAKLVQQWNGWTPVRYRKACDELAKASLVLEAKRERAGRAHFLPGGWEALKSPDPPFETWKMPMYGLRRPGGSGPVYRPLGALLPLLPVHDLFEWAWRRLSQEADVPKYEEVK